MLFYFTLWYVQNIYGFVLTHSFSTYDVICSINSCVLCCVAGWVGVARPRPAKQTKPQRISHTVCVVCCVLFCVAATIAHKPSANGGAQLH